MANFKTQFDSYVCDGDTITTEHKGFTFTARLERDIDATPFDADCYTPKQVKAWRNDEWHFFGVVISVALGGIELDDHAASLWGIEGNFPSRRKNPNTYFRDVANDLLGEALGEARQHAERLGVAISQLEEA